VRAFIFIFQSRGRRSGREDSALGTSRRHPFVRSLFLTEHDLIHAACSPVNTYISSGCCRFSTSDGIRYRGDMHKGRPQGQGVRHSAWYAHLLMCFFFAIIGTLDSFHLHAEEFVLNNFF
jgi:hypothetical protein